MSSLYLHLFISSDSDCTPPVRKGRGTILFPCHSTLLTGPVLRTLPDVIEGPDGREGPGVGDETLQSHPVEVRGTRRLVSALNGEPGLGFPGVQNSTVGSQWCKVTPRTLSVTKLGRTPGPETLVEEED